MENLNNEHIYMRSKHNTHKTVLLGLLLQASVNALYINQYLLTHYTLINTYLLTIH